MAKLNSFLLSFCRPNRANISVFQLPMILKNTMTQITTLLRSADKRAHTNWRHEIEWVRLLGEKVNKIPVNFPGTSPLRRRTWIMKISCRKNLWSFYDFLPHSFNFRLALNFHGIQPRNREKKSVHRSTFFLCPVNMKSLQNRSEPSTENTN